MYRFDALTGLLNRLSFNEAFDKMKRAPENAGIPLTVLMVDLNHLKSINDEKGHDAGDRAIAAVATAMKAACPGNSLCVRFGGDEMLAFIPGEIDADRIIANMNSQLEKASKRNGYSISASCGTYRTVLSEDIDMEAAVREADERMYIEKKRSRGEA